MFLGKQSFKWNYMLITWLAIKAKLLEVLCSNHPPIEYLLKFFHGLPP